LTDANGCYYETAIRLCQEAITILAESVQKTLTKALREVLMFSLNGIGILSNSLKQYLFAIGT